jgi:hypothetical protein
MHDELAALEKKWYSNNDADKKTVNYSVSHKLLGLLLMDRETFSFDRIKEETKRIARRLPFRVIGYAYYLVITGG